MHWNLTPIEPDEYINEMKAIMSKVKFQGELQELFKARILNIIFPNILPE